MAWLILFLAGIFEVVWAFAMKLSAGFTKPVPVIVMVCAMIASFVLLAQAMRTLPLGIAYPIWTGIGAVGAFIVGVIALGEGLSAARVLGLGLLVAGMAVLKFSASA